jgi:hypothetical protein
MKVIRVVGGLGSQMMAYSLYLSMADRSDDNVICDFSWFHYHQSHNGAELNRIFGVEENRINRKLDFLFYSEFFVAKWIRKITFGLGFLKKYRAERKKYNYDEDVFYRKGNVVYYQCWTSWKYFENVEQKVVDAFQFPTISEPKNIEILDLIENSNSVAIHVRRGDYLESASLRGLAPDHYYSSAMNHIDENIDEPVYFVFSNDIEWCKENIQSNNIHYISWNSGGSSFRDMQLMARCKHNIIPNSTFSWWGAYLNRNPGKIVVAPEKWSNPETGVELNDMNMPSWVAIKNY